MGRVEGDLRAGPRVVLAAENGWTIEVAGTAGFRGDAGIDATLHAGAIDVRDGRLTVRGDLAVRGEVRARDASVEVGGALTATHVGVDGAVEIGAGHVRGSLEAGGKLRSSGSLEFGSLEVGGSVRLGAGSKGGRIEAGGRFRADGDLTFTDLEVGGLADIAGSAYGTHVKVAGRLAVAGGLQLTGRIEVGGQARVRGDLRAVDLEIGGEGSARRAVLEGRAEVGGHVATAGGVFAHEIRLERRATVVGPLVGATVILGRKARAEAVYGRTVRLEDGSTATSVAGEVVSVGDRCEVGSLRYSHELVVGREATFRVPPQKVESVTPFPTPANG